MVLNVVSCTCIAEQKPGDCHIVMVTRRQAGQHQSEGSIKKGQ